MDKVKKKKGEEDYISESYATMTTLQNWIIKYVAQNTL